MPQAIQDPLTVTFICHGWPEHGRRARRALAVDGKLVRGTRRASSDGQAVHLLAVARVSNIAATCRHHARDATPTLATLGLSQPCAYAGIPEPASMGPAGKVT